VAPTKMCERGDAFGSGIGGCSRNEYPSLCISIHHQE
jgi:hypothetical protein